MSDLAVRFKAVEDDCKDALATLDNVLKHVAAANPAAELRVIILNNVIVALISTTEESLRELFHEYLTVLEENFEDHKMLSLDLRKANLDCGIQQLKNATRDSDFRRAAAIAGDLSKCLKNEQGYRLFKKELTYNEGNFRSRQLTTTAKRVGIEELWPRISDSAEVKEYTDEPVRDTRTNKLIADWNAVFDERDRIVHKISEAKASGWSEDKIRGAMRLSLLIVCRVCTCLIEELERLIGRNDRSSS
jgi:hypothetical protein